MPFLVRKIMRASNVKKLEDWPENRPLKSITADVTTNEFRSTGSELSTWRIDSMDELDQAALAIALGGTKIEDIQLMIVDLEEIERNFTVKATKGNTLATRLVNMHRDICGVSHESLDKLLAAYKYAADHKRCRRYKTKRLRELVKAELEAGQVDIDAAGEQMERDLNDLKKNT